MALSSRLVFGVRPESCAHTMPNKFEQFRRYPGRASNGREISPLQLAIMKTSRQRRNKWRFDGDSLRQPLLV
jgi:hypothetical protein